MKPEGIEFPPLIIAPANPSLHLTSKDAEDIKKCLARQQEQGGPVIFGHATNLWQFIDGKWEALPTKVEAVPDQSKSLP